MEKIIFDNTVFYYDNGSIFDEYFLVVHKDLALKVLENYYSNTDYTKLGETELLDFVKAVKKSELYGFCLKVITFGLSKFPSSFEFYRIVFPIITSCYRALGTPQKSIDFWFEHKQLFRSCLSTPLLTSLAAAYCDVGDYVSAKKCADHAYALQGGAKGYVTELSLVYERIKKETKNFK